MRNSRELLGPSETVFILPQTQEALEAKRQGLTAKLQQLAGCNDDEGSGLQCIINSHRGELTCITGILDSAKIIEPPKDPQKIERGTKFTVRFGAEEGSKRFVLGYSLADVAHYPAGKDEAVLSGKSSFGEAVLGKGPGEAFEYATPGGEIIKGTIKEIGPITSS